MNQATKGSPAKSTTRVTPTVKVLMLDFSPTQIAELWHAASSMLPVIEVRMYCRTSAELDRTSTLADEYDVILVDSAEQSLWFRRLESDSLKTLLGATIVIAGIEPMGSVQTALLRAGYSDVVCVQDVHARTIVNATIKAFLRTLKSRQIELAPTIAAPIQRAII